VRLFGHEGRSERAGVQQGHQPPGSRERVEVGADGARLLSVADEFGAIASHHRGPYGRTSREASCKSVPFEGRTILLRQSIAHSSVEV
jgi:hypothetical protein